MAEIKSVNELLNMNVDIPDYQRPYKLDSLYWKETMYKKHEEEMMKYLMDACGIGQEED